VEKVRALMLGLRIIQVARAQVTRAGPRVIFSVGQLRRPHAVFAAFDLCYGLSLIAAPGAERITARSVTRNKRPARSILWGEPVGPRMVEDDVEDDAQPRGMRIGHKFDQIPPVAEMWIHVEEVLNGVAVIRIQMASLFEDRPDPERRHAEVFQIAEFGANPAQRSALPPLRARLRPAIPPPRLAVGQSGASGDQIATVEQRTRLFLPVAETIRQQEVKRFVAPIGGRWVITFAAGQGNIAHIGRTIQAELCVCEWHWVISFSLVRVRLANQAKL